MRVPFPPRRGPSELPPGTAVVIPRPVGATADEVCFSGPPSPLGRCPATPVDGKRADAAWKGGAGATRGACTARATWSGSGRSRTDGAAHASIDEAPPPACPPLPRQACHETLACPAVCQLGPVPLMSVGRWRRDESEGCCQQRLPATTTQGAGAVSACVFLRT